MISHKGKEQDGFYVLPHLILTIILKGIMMPTLHMRKLMVTEVPCCLPEPQSSSLLVGN